MKNFIVVGGGLSGCTVAYLLKKKYCDANIKLFESNEIGGLCKTYEHQEINYELGPHILYSGNKKIEQFFSNFLDNKEMKYFQKLSIDGTIDDLYNFPVSVADVIRLNPRTAIELYNIELSNPDFSNVENYLISRVGRTAYEYFFKNYNIKQWGIHPRKMETEWISQRRIFLRNHVESVFGNKWQGHPGSYNPMFEKLTENIEIVFENVDNIDTKNGKVYTKEKTYDADFILNTAPIDLLFENKSKLNYRGILWVYALLDTEYAFPTYLTSFPNNYSFTRIMEYKHQTQQMSDKTLLSFDFPFDSSDDLSAFDDICKKEAHDFLEMHFPGKTQYVFSESRRLSYPVSQQTSLDYFWELLKQNISDKWITFGRLGLYSYISMDTCVEQCMNVVEVIDKWESMSMEEKVAFYEKTRCKQT